MGDIEVTVAFKRNRGSDRLEECPVRMFFVSDTTNEEDREALRTVLSADPFKGFEQNDPSRMRFLLYYDGCITGFDSAVDALIKNVLTMMPARAQ